MPPWKWNSPPFWRRTRNRRPRESMRRARSPPRNGPMRSAAVDLGGQDFLGQLPRRLAILGGLQPPPQDLGPGPTERAEPPRRGLSALLARRERGAVLGPEQMGRLVQVSHEELCLGPGRTGLDRVHGLLVAKLRVPGHERALLHDVVDPS